MNCRVFLNLVASVCISAFGQEVLISDFESASYGSWTRTGTAFGTQPTLGTLPNQNTVTGYLGSRLVSSFVDGDSTTGTLTSPLFKVERKYIRFLVGGGNDRERTCVNLLSNGTPVRSATGMGDREALDWVQWDVGTLLGSNVCIRIVDHATGEWGHINADHFGQADEPLPNILRVQKRFLHLPVRTGNPKRLLELLNQGLVTHEFNIELAETDPEFYVFLDLSKLQGSELMVRIDSQPATAAILSLLQQADSVPNEKGIYREAHRPIFHFTARRGWLNDPNGLVYANGEYHLGYQHNPYGWRWDNMHWGYAVSTNLVHWRELPEALYPDPLGAMWSGSTVVDSNNTAGFGLGALVAIYTAAGGASGVLPRMSRTKDFSQCIAWSLDQGRSWTKYTNNPVLSNVKGDNRDPKVLWYAPQSKWVMVLWLDGNEFALFSSPNLKNWTQTSTFNLPGIIEVPDLFPLALNGNANQTKWIFWAGAGSYVVGSFDGSTFTPECGPFSIRNGNCFAATQTFENIPASDGRRILIIHGTAQFPGMPFNNNMNFPLELTLRGSGSGPRIYANPIRELALLRNSTNTWGSQPLVSGNSVLAGTTGEAFELDVTFAPGTADRVSFNLRGTTVTYDVQGRRLTCGRYGADLQPLNGRIRLQMLVDRGIIELFGDEGKVYMPLRVAPQTGALPVGCSAEGEGAQLISMTLHHLRSAFLPASGFKVSPSGG